MPMTEDIADLAANLGQLPHPELGTLSIVNFSTFAGQDDELQTQINVFTTQVATAILNFWDQRGKMLVDKADVTGPPKLGSYNVVTVLCSGCGGRLLQVTPGPDGTASVPHQLMPGQHRCPV